VRKAAAFQVRLDGLRSISCSLSKGLHELPTSRVCPASSFWFEQVLDRPPKARAFYEKLFAWHCEAMPMGDKTYYVIHNGATGIGGFRVADPGVPSHWMSYLSVDNVDRSFERAPPTAPSHACHPRFRQRGPGRSPRDPTGAMFCLWTGAEDDPIDVETTPFGGWCWNELWTPDAKRALPSTRTPSDTPTTR